MKLENCYCDYNEEHYNWLKENCHLTGYQFEGDTLQIDGIMYTYKGSIEGRTKVELIEGYWFEVKDLHTTIGIYPNGYPKFNGVAHEDLQYHIEYNRGFRSGRALMIDGEIILKGYASNKQVDEEYLAPLRLEKMDRCTVPYQ